MMWYWHWFMANYYKTLLDIWFWWTYLDKQTRQMQRSLLARAVELRARQKEAQA